MAIGYLPMFISQVYCSLVVRLLASACDRWSCADLHLHARAPSVHLSQVLLLPLSSLLVLLFGFVLFCLSCFQFRILHCMYYIFILEPSVCVCISLGVCVFSWIMGVLFPDEALASSPLSFCFWNPSVFAFLLNPWAFFFLSPPSWKCLLRFVSLVCPRCFTAENYTRGVAPHASYRGEKQQH